LADWSVVVVAVFVVVTVVVADWTFVVVLVIIIAVKGVCLVEKYVLFSCTKVLCAAFLCNILAL